MPEDKKTYYIDLPVNPNIIKELHIGDIIYLSGNIMTARDRAHQRIIEYKEILKKKLPEELKKLENCAIYHCGPIIKDINVQNDESTNKKIHKIYSGGPTTSSRMEPFQEKVCNYLNIRIVIGKGGMNLEFPDFKSVYLAFVGGCGAVFVSFVKNIENVIWEDLGMPEAIWILEVEKFGPLIVTQDSWGKNLYENH